MVRKVGILALLTVSVFFLVSPAKADSITVTWGEQNGLSDQRLPFTIDAGTVAFAIPNGQSIVSAIFTSTLGNSTVSNTAVMDVFVNSILVGSCKPGDIVCAFSDAPTPFTYIYTSADLASLASGLVDLTITQTDCCVIRLGPSTLTINTAASAVPEPTTGLLLGTGLLIAAAMRRRTAKRA